MKKKHNMKQFNILKVEGLAKTTQQEKKDRNKRSKQMEQNQPQTLSLLY